MTNPSTPIDLGVSHTLAIILIVLTSCSRMTLATGSYRCLNCGSNFSVTTGVGVLTDVDVSSLPDVNLDAITGITVAGCQSVLLISSNGTIGVFGPTNPEPFHLDDSETIAGTTTSTDGRSTLSANTDAIIELTCFANREITEPTCFVNDEITKMSTPTDCESILPVNCDAITAATISPPIEPSYTANIDAINTKATMDITHGSN